MKRWPEAILMMLVGAVALMCIVGCGHNHPTGKKFPPASNPASLADTVADNLNRNSASIADAVAFGIAHPDACHDELTRIGEANAGNIALVPQIQAVSKGISVMQKSNDDLQKQNDSSRQPFYRLLDYGLIAAGVLIAAGFALFATGKPAGIGLGVFGIGLAISFMTFRAASPILPYIVAAMGVIAVVAVAYLVYEHLRVRHKALAEAEQKAKLAENLQVERRATVDLVNTVDAVKDAIQPSKAEELFGVGGIVNKIQSAPTKALVAEARQVMANSKSMAAPLPEPPPEPSTPVSGVVIGMTGASSVSGEVTPTP